ncbi:MAG: hypothetical protein DCC58_10460 [Chloroflexi bacterium]|nr:MAG: hypothetical protein DCC58_10460 [Chloroflexota bacterium]
MGRYTAGGIGGVQAVNDGSIDRWAADDEFVAGLRVGSTAAYDTLVDRYHARLMPVLVRMLGGDVAAAEDLAQDTFLAVYRSLHTLTAEHSFEGWLYKIARNNARRYNRRRMLVQFVPLDSVVSLLSGSRSRAHDDLLDEASVIDDIQVVLDQMPPKEREAFLLHSMAELTAREIAPIMGIREAAASALVTRGTRRFATLYQARTGHLPSARTTRQRLPSNGGPP